MTTHPNLNNEPELLKIKTTDDEIKNSKHQTEKHDHENILVLRLIMKKNKKLYKSLYRKKILLIITEIVVGSGSAIGTSTMSVFSPSMGVVLTSSTALLTSIAILIMIEYIPELKKDIQNYVIG